MQEINISYFAVPGVDRNITNIERVIINTVCNYFKVSREDIKSKKRFREMTFARHIAMFLIRTMTAKRYVKIGEIFNRDHSTALNAMIKINGFLDIKDSQTIIALEEISNNLRINNDNSTGY